MGMRAQENEYARRRRAFRWKVPARYNMAVHACDAVAAQHPDRPAVFLPDGDGFTPVSYGALAALSNRLAHALVAHGVATGDRVAILLPHSLEVLAAHLAVYKMGAVAVPLAGAFGIEAIAYRLADCGAKALVTDDAGLAKLADPPESLTLVVNVDGARDKAVAFSALVEAASDRPLDIASGPDDPALMIYTSGTTGQPKGALHGHRVLLAHVSGVTFTHEGIGAPGDRMWTPSDWAWAGGLLNTVLPALALGVPVVAQPRGKFDPEAAFALMARAQVRNVFIPPTALRMMRQVRDPARFGFTLRTVGSAGEALGAETFEWGRAALGVPVNEFYGQTECNYVIGSSAALGVARAGATGKAVPGHEVAVLGADGAVLPPGVMGEIAVRAPDPVMFLGYWNRPEATADKVKNGWLLTGDLATQDEDGYFHFLGRDDDVITSAGYRIGPAEIEDVLLRHPAVAMAAAVGVSDPLRTEIVKAVIVPALGIEPTPELEADLREFVRTRLAAYEYPRAFEFVRELPLTTTGKVIRRLLRG